MSITRNKIVQEGREAYFDNSKTSNIDDSTVWGDLCPYAPRSHEWLLWMAGMCDAQYSKHG